MRLVLTLLLVACCAVASAKELRLVIDQYAAGDFKDAASGFKSLAKQGDPRAQFYLGLMYRNGEGVPRSDERAIYWYAKAAEQGHPDAQFNLGLIHDSGDGVPRDAQRALYWYTKAAQQGNNNARFYLWYIKASEHKDPDAQFYLGLMYRNGDGVPRNDKQALYWYTKAARQGNVNAQFHLGLIHDIGDGVACEDQFRNAYLLGCVGAWSLHPSQIDIAKRVFSPDADEVAHARRVIEAMGDGTGAIMLDGKMEDDASVKQCHVVMGLARQLAERDPDLADLYGF